MESDLRIVINFIAIVNGVPITYSLNTSSWMARKILLNSDMAIDVLYDYLSDVFKSSDMMIESRLIISDDERGDRLPCDVVTRINECYPPDAPIKMKHGLLLSDKKMQKLRRVI